VSRYVGVGTGGDSLAWSVLGTLLAGPLLYGLIGFGIDTWLHTAVFVPVGLVLGCVLSFYGIWVKHFRDPDESGWSTKVGTTSLTRKRSTTSTASTTSTTGTTSTDRPSPAPVPLGDGRSTQTGERR
jgi:hypothetical protein